MTVETIVENFTHASGLYRVEVPGGWIYRRSDIDALVFVPEPVTMSESAMEVPPRRYAPHPRLKSLTQGD